MKRLSFIALLGWSCVGCIHTYGLKSIERSGSLRTDARALVALPEDVQQGEIHYSGSGHDIALTVKEAFAARLNGADLTLATGEWKKHLKLAQERGFNYLVARLRNEEAARQTSEARLEFMAHHDGLTGLHNRIMLEDRLEQALARAERAGTQVALLFCDLDGFKPINDRYGHDAGDVVLRQIAQRLSQGRRRTDTVARLGGDEFVILLADLDDARAAAKTVAEQCLTAIREPFEIDGTTLTLGMSICIALHAGTAIAPSYLISQADIAMYRAKHAGKGSYFFIEYAIFPVRHAKDRFA